MYLSKNGALKVCTDIQIVFGKSSQFFFFFFWVLYFKEMEVYLKRENVYLMYHTPPKKVYLLQCNMLFQILTTTFPRRIGDTGILPCMYIFFQDTCYYKMCCRCIANSGCAARGGVSWKNLASPVMINHLPQFAVEFENAEISRIWGFIHLHATVSHHHEFHEC